MRVAIFGVGQFYRNRHEELMALCAGDEIVVFFDNKFKNKSQLDGVPAIPPKLINSVTYDCVIIMSVHIAEIYNQLYKAGIDEGKIYTWKQFKAEKSDRVEEYSTTLTGKGEKILIIANPIRYDGGSMAAIYAAIALRSKDYCVWIMAEYVEEELRKRLKKDGINLAIYNGVPYIGKRVRKWIDRFSIILVNVFPNIHSVCELGKYKPVIWWLHESDVYGKVYQETFNLFPQYKDGIDIGAADVVAVSDKAKVNFQRYYPEKEVRIMPYGLPDEIAENNKSDKLVFAIIGNVSYLKGQDVFLKAAKKFADIKGKRAEFWLIGNNKSVYAENLLAEVSELDYIKIKGEVGRAEMKKKLSEIDVVVSASREDSLPIVITEGMMNGKICIISDAVGSVKYIRNMYNGIVFKSQNVDELADRMIWCFDNRKKLSLIGKRARKTYEDYFSIDVFADRLEHEVLFAKRKYKRK